MFQGAEYCPERGFFFPSSRKISYISSRNAVCIIMLRRRIAQKYWISSLDPQREPGFY
ncbi:Hypothetical protein BAAA_1000163 [Brucella abortus str. 2308 A]|nr:Hypothetical protein BAAA_1000163 [Brucella abortus str. 2308 A]